MREPRRRHAASLLVPAREPRKTRRARVKAERALAAELARAEQAARRERRDAEKAARRDTPFLPRSGERGPAAGRSRRPLRVQAHRATSATLAAAYSSPKPAWVGRAS